MKIWLDDLRDPPDGTWVWARTPKEFITAPFVGIIFPETNPEYLEIEVVSLDHDLGLDKHTKTNGVLIPPKEISEVTGYDCAVWFIQTYKLLGKTLPRIVCHSQNPAGRERIERLIEEQSQ